MSLIAKVRVAAYVDGARQEFAPGEALPELPAHDVEALKRMGAVADAGEAVAAEADEQALRERAGAEFDAARAQVRAARASIAPAPAPKKKP